MHNYNSHPIHDINPITEITHSPLYPMVLLTLYFFAIGFTIGNYTGYFRFNTETYGDSFTRAYLAFTVLGAICFFFVSAVAWLWAAKYTHAAESRVRKLTFGFIAIFLFHDLPCFSMELHAILEHGWRNGYQGFCFVVQIITFLLSFTNGWLYFTWVMAGWCQYWYGWPYDSMGLKTGQEHLDILPPMSPAEREQNVSTPMLGSGLRWNGQPGVGGGGSGMRGQTIQRQPSIADSNYTTRGRSNSNNGSRNGNYNITPRNNNNDEVLVDDNLLFSSRQRVEAPNSGLRRQGPPDAFGPQSSNQRSNNNNSQGQQQYNFRESQSNTYRQPSQQQQQGGGQSGIRPVNFIDGLEDGGEQPPSSSRSSASQQQQHHQGGINFNNIQPVSLMTSPAMSRLRTSTSGNYVPLSPSKNGGQGILSNHNFGDNNNLPSTTSTQNSNWRDEIPAVTGGAGPQGGNVQWTQNRRNML